MADAPCDEDEVLLTVRVELLTASRAALISTADRTYFDGLLNGGKCKSDVIGMLTIT
jgi:hypothetical protein